jgi:ABC-type multidrug transport system fused ATPase/permease subunit
MEDNFSNYFNQTGKVAKDYLETRLDLIKLQAAGKLSRALALFFSLILAFLLFFFAIVFLGMVLGFWIGEMTNSYTIGFSCSAGLFVFFLMVIMWFREPLIQRPLSNMLIKEMVSEMEIEEKVEEEIESKLEEQEEEDHHEQL